MPSTSYTQRLNFYVGQRTGTVNEPIYSKDLPAWGFTPYTTVVKDNSGNSSREDNLIGWEERIKRGESATTNVNADRTTHKASPGTLGYLVYRDNRSYNYGWRKGILCPPPDGYNKPMPASEMIYLDQLAQLKFLKKAQNAQRKFQSPTFLAELHETVQMFRHPIRSIINELGKHQGRLRRTLGRNGRLREWRTRSRQGPSATAQRIVSDQWLQTQFGLLPFISDMDDAAEALKGFFERMSDRPTRIPVKAFVQRDVKSVDLQFSTDGFGDISYKRLFTDQRTERVTYRGAVKLVPYEDQVFSSIRTHFGFDWRTAVLTTWEIIPYSFLVDYFVNIGDMLEASLFNQANLAWVNRTWKSHGTASVEIASGTIRVSTDGDPHYSSVERHRGEGAIGVRTMSSISRLRVIWPLTASIQFRVPGWGTKALNLAALARLRIP